MNVLSSGEKNNFFVKEMEVFSFEKMDDYLKNNKSLMSDFYLSVTKESCIKYLITYQLFVIAFSFLVSLFMAEDILIKFLAIGFLSFSLFLVGLFFIGRLLNNKYSQFKDDVWVSLNEIKNKFIYNNNEVIDSLIFSKIYHEVKFEKIKENISSKSLSNDDLFFILHCVKNESNYEKLNKLNKFCKKLKKSV